MIATQVKSSRTGQNGFLLAALLVCLHCCSCASLPELPWAPVARDASAGFYNTARLEYRLDAGKLGQPLDVLRVDGRQVDYEKIASSPLADHSIGTLIIEKPHPAGREGYARVTFSIDSSEATPAGRSALDVLKFGQTDPPIGTYEEVHETWAMDLPSGEADRYFSLLSQVNFYGKDLPAATTARLAVTMDGRKVEKPWESLAELNGLAQQVRSHGRLVAYLRPQALSGQPTNAIASVRAYRELQAKTGGGPSATVAQKPLPYAAR